jgi:hypothetical protein
VEGVGQLIAEVIISLNDKASELKTPSVYCMLENVGLCVLKKLDVPVS